MKTSFVFKFRHFLVIWIPILMFMGAVILAQPDLIPEKNDPARLLIHNKVIEMLGFAISAIALTVLLWVGGWKQVPATSKIKSKEIH